jgi:hypothetical protein
MGSDSGRYLCGMVTSYVIALRREFTTYQPVSGSFASGN